MRTRWFHEPHAPPGVFVYGLLRRGQSMQDLLQGARDLGMAEVEHYELLDLGPYPARFPAAARSSASWSRLRDDAQLELLDQAEGCDRTPPLYERVEVTVRGKPAWIYEYAGDTTGVPRIASGDWARRR